MKFEGRHIDPVALWSGYVDFPPNMSVDEHTGFLPLVRCPNPDHQTEKRHFQINIDRPLVHCFANCGISGTYEHAISTITGDTRRNARREIFKHARLAPVRKKRKGVAKKRADIDLGYDTFVPQAGMEYLSSRGISGASIAKWEIGWDSNDLRVVYPIKDLRGRVRLLCKASIRAKDQPKYLYTEGVERNSLLYGACNINPGLVRSFGIVLVEGCVDTILNDQHGFSTTLGILGSKLSEQQAKLIMKLRPLRVYTMFDADAAGVAATGSVISLLRGVPIRVCRYPKGKTDPAMLNQREAERAISTSISSGRYRTLVREITTTRSRPKERVRVGKD